MSRRGSEAFDLRSLRNLRTTESPADNEEEIKLDEGDLFDVQEKRSGMPPPTPEQRIPWAKDKGVMEKDIVSEEEEFEHLLEEPTERFKGQKETKKDFERRYDFARERFSQIKNSLSAKEKKEFDLNLKILEKFLDVIETKQEVAEFDKKTTEFEDKLSEYRTGEEDLKAAGKAIYKKPKETFVKAKDMPEWEAIHQKAKGHEDIDDNLLDDWMDEGDRMGAGKINQVQMEIDRKNEELKKLGFFSFFSKEKRILKTQLKDEIAELEKSLKELAEERANRGEVRAKGEVVKRAGVVSGEIGGAKPETKQEVKPEPDRADLGRRSMKRMGKLATTVAAAGIAVGGAAAYEASIYNDENNAKDEVVDFNAVAELKIESKKRDRAFIPPEGKPFTMEQHAAPIVEAPKKTRKPHKKVASKVKMHLEGPPISRVLEEDIEKRKKAQE